MTEVSRTDLVAELLADCYCLGGTVHERAAAEIERLRQQVAELEAEVRIQHAHKQEADATNLYWKARADRLAGTLREMPAALRSIMVQTDNLTCHDVHNLAEVLLSEVEAALAQEPSQ